MDQPAIIGIDISKSVLQLHAATEDGSPVLRKKLTRGRYLPFLAELPECLVVMEACGGAHQLGRRIKELGRECRLVPPVHAFGPPMESFRSGRDFAACGWAGSRRWGSGTFGTCLSSGPTSVLRHRRKENELANPRLHRMIAEKPPKLVAVALANRMRGSFGRFRCGTSIHD